MTDWKTAPRGRADRLPRGAESFSWTRRDRASKVLADARQLLRYAEAAPAKEIRLLEARDRPVPTIFHEAWWLDIATDGHWRTADYVEGGRVVGWMPYFPVKRFGLLESRMPFLTHFLGPAIVEQHGKTESAFRRSSRICHGLIAQLPDFVSFYQKMHRGIGNVVPFQAERFRATAQFTFVIEPDRTETVWATMRDKTRNSIRAAERVCAFGRKVDAETFLDFYMSNQVRSGRPPLKHRRVARRLIETCYAKDCGDVTYVTSETGRIAAAVFCVWDTEACFYLMSTRSPESKSGAVPLLLWRAICEAMSRGLRFDFDGIAFPGCIPLYSGFGGRVEPRFIVHRAKRGFETLREIRGLFGGDDNLLGG